MIIGIGTDLVDISRIQNLLDTQGERFKERVFTPHERAQGKNDASFYAKRFAAKEACAKAFGTGFGNGFSMNDIGVDNDELGAPVLVLSGGAEKKLKELQGRAHLSLSDEQSYAQAFVVIEKL